MRVNYGTFGVVGVSFVDGYPDNLLRLADVYENAKQTGERATVVLVRNPDNPYDANAVEVHVPPIGMIGHLDRRSAAVVAPMLDAGHHWHAQVSWVRINPDHLDRPGIDIEIEMEP